ncbi:MAG: hypothetical protein ACPG5B_04080 [Chitinophagales bacterium]
MSNIQIKHLEYFVQSPYFNKKEEVLQLFQHIISFKPQYKNKKLDRHFILANLFNNKKYNEKDIGYWTSDLVQIVNDFLTFESLKKEDIMFDNLLLTQYNLLHLDSSFQTNLKKTKKHFKQKKLRNAQYYYDSFLINRQENAFFDRQKKHRHNESLQKTVDDLDLFYFIEKLKYSCELINRQQIVATSYEVHFIQEIMHYLEKTKYKNEPAIAIYITILKCLLEAEEEIHFANLKLLLANNYHLFEKTEARDMYMYGINYCVKKINMGAAHYFKELFVIYKTSLEKALLYDGSYLSPWSFKNIVAVAIKNKEYTWLEQFIQSHKKRLAVSFRQNAYSYSMADLFFHQRKYKKAMQELLQVSFDDVFYSTESKVLLMCIYYELDEIEALLALADSFKIYLRRSKLLSDNHIIVYMNFIKLLARLAKAEKYESKKIKRILERLNSLPKVANKTWLYEKISEKQ